MPASVRVGDVDGFIKSNHHSRHIQRSRDESVCEYIPTALLVSLSLQKNEFFQLLSRALRQCSLCCSPSIFQACRWRTLERRGFALRGSILICQRGAVRVCFRVV